MLISLASNKQNFIIELSTAKVKKYLKNSSKPYIPIIFLMISKIKKIINRKIKNNTKN
jgi:hypothetical protein